VVDQVLAHEQGDLDPRSRARTIKSMLDGPVSPTKVKSPFRSQGEVRGNYRVRVL
jgi:hypothetical protein